LFRNPGKGPYLRGPLPLPVLKKDSETRRVSLSWPPSNSPHILERSFSADFDNIWLEDA
jgi:hypothetical protein